MTRAEKLFQTLSLSKNTGNIVIASHEELDKEEAKFFITLVRDNIASLPQVIRGSNFTFIYGSKKNFENKLYQDNFLKKCEEIPSKNITFFIV